ncbi:hypothetical protein [Aquimarina sp. AU58]|uniref:hypothetical protein n=1 Tax=Aquimarina sp. AU58 TaxID=1874112 RepID=UPI001359AF93|nr:hypothetical protein [Aquimarina sp. AU58]
MKEKYQIEIIKKLIKFNSLKRITFWLMTISIINLLILGPSYPDFFYSTSYFITVGVLGLIWVVMIIISYLNRGFDKDLVRKQRTHEFLDETILDELNDMDETVIPDEDISGVKKRLDDIKEILIGKLSTDPIKIHIEDLEERIFYEISNLRRNANLNLGIGIAATVVAVISLGYVILTQEIQDVYYDKFLMNFIPRLSLVLFIELFAFFFLKQYKSNLEDIKYYNNEKTNIDFRILAIKIAETLEDKTMHDQIINSFISIDRNFKLDKDQSTIQLEKMKLDNEQNLQLSNLLAKAIDKLK